jgi:hypothetical protein
MLIGVKAALREHGIQVQPTGSGLLGRDFEFNPVQLAVEFRLSSDM